MKNNDNLTAHSALSYDEHIRQSIPNYDSFHEETVNLVAAYSPNPDFWLDTGCGTGTLILKAYSTFLNTKFVLADPSAAMLEIAKQKLNSIDNVIILPPCETIDLNLSEKVDVITAIQAHHYLDMRQRKASTEKCFDLLKPQGIFITFENIRPLTERGTEIGKEYWKRFQEHAGKPKEEAQKHLERFGNEYHPITVLEHLELLKWCHFKVVEIFWYSYMQAGFYCIK
jgi:tRNA (cmo5U34)-methyltransferase